MFMQIFVKYFWLKIISQLFVLFWIKKTVALYWAQDFEDRIRTST